jgi:hypothetical protein
MDQANSIYFDNFAVVKENSSLYSYDANGNLTSTVENPIQKTQMTYDKNNLTSVTDARNYTYNYKYDDKHNLLQAITQNKVTTDNNYDAYGNNIQTIIRNSSSSLQIKTDLSYLL